ncbi:hypothetical protein [Cellulomonas endophytica]|uniref:hypothetical protein n=1 Tax=Cellulomonas endophytica TaxID=2494735 RepID=UPI001011CADE|nr:hypothetical protein [Cellulomonas endophytica]
MDTFLVPVTFPDLDTAKRETAALVAALRTAGLHAESVDAPTDDGEEDAGRPDPGPTTVELHVRDEGEAAVRERVREVAEGRFPPGMLLLGDPVRL